jgi:hypothetical protein
VNLSSLRLRSVLLAAAVFGLAGCYANPGDPDTGWCCNRPQCLPCEGCVTLIPDPVSMGGDCQPRCAPTLPGRPVARLRYNDPALPPANCVIVVPPSEETPSARHYRVLHFGPTAPR